MVSRGKICFGNNKKAACYKAAFKFYQIEDTLLPKYITASIEAASVIQALRKHSKMTKQPLITIQKSLCMKE